MSSPHRHLVALLLALCAVACGNNQGSASGNPDGTGANGPGANGSGANSAGGAGQGPSSGTGTVKLTLRAK